MNEVIRKLALDAHLINYIDNETPRRYFISGDGLPDCEKVQRFAELLVRECLSYLEDYDVDFAKWMIKQNFGVEE